MNDVTIQRASSASGYTQHRGRVPFNSHLLLRQRALQIIPVPLQVRVGLLAQHSFPVNVALLVQVGRRHHAREQRRRRGRHRRRRRRRPNLGRRRTPRRSLLRLAVCRRVVHIIARKRSARTARACRVRSVTPRLARCKVTDRRSGQL